MTHLIIAAWDKNNHPTKINTKETEAESITLVNKLKNELNHPNAFYVADYNGMDIKYCIVDSINKTVSWDTITEQIDIDAAALQIILDKRQAAYPSLGNFADAYVHTKNGDDTHMTAYVAACNKVKADYPKS